MTVAGESKNVWPGGVRPFRPPRWLVSPHAQTVGGKLLRPRARVALRRERIETRDGDVLDLDFTAGDARRPLVVVLHGLEGSARRRYMVLTYRDLERAGMEAVGLNFRGCSGEPNRTARAYHSGETGDLRFVIGRLQERFPGRTLGAVGYSLGGNVLLKHLGETGDASGLAAAVAVSVPFDLAAGADAVGSGIPGQLLYTPYFLHSLKRKTLAKAHLVERLCDLGRVRTARTLRAFDDAVTAPLHGFDDADDYYRRSSSARFIPGIRTPTLVLQARDDPFLPADRIPETALRANAHVAAALTERGGHLGFVHRGRPRFWAESEAARFLNRQLSARNSREG